MAIIQRSDGIQFAIRCYRETLSLVNTRILRHEAFRLSEEHGYFTRFLRSKAPRTSEAVFSTDSGYLLAELIWSYFEKPANLIFCEKLGEEQYLTVIVRDSLVYTDGNLNQAELAEELAFASHNMHAASVFLYGDIPGFPTSPANAASNDPDNIPLIAYNLRNVKHLSASLFNQIQPLEIFLLVPIQQALNDLQLSKSSKQKKIALIIFLVLAFAGSIVYGVMNYQAKKAQEEFLKRQRLIAGLSANAAIPTDPLDGFKKALSTPSPKDYVNALTQKLNLLMTIPGWSFGMVQISNNNLSVAASSYGGSADALLDWAKSHGVSVLLNVSTANLSLSFPLPAKRAAPKQPAPLQGLVAQLIDRLSFLSLGHQNALQLVPTSSKGAYRVQSAVINFSALNTQ